MSNNILVDAVERINELLVEDGGLRDIDHLVNIFVESFPIITSSQGKADIQYSGESKWAVLDISDNDNPKILLDENNHIRLFDDQDEAIANIPLHPDGTISDDFKQKLVVEWGEPVLRWTSTNPIHSSSFPLDDNDRQKLFAKSKERAKDDIQSLMKYVEGGGVDIDNKSTLSLPPGEYSSDSDLLEQIQDRHKLILSELAQRASTVWSVDENEVTEIPPETLERMGISPFTIPSDLVGSVKVRSFRQEIRRVAELVLVALDRAFGKATNISEILAHSHTWQFQEGKITDPKRTCINPDEDRGVLEGSSFNDCEKWMTDHEITLQPIVRDIGGEWYCVATLNIDDISHVRPQEWPETIDQQSLEPCGLWGPELVRFPNTEPTSAIRARFSRPGATPAILFRWSQSDVDGLEDDDIRECLDVGLHIVTSYDIRCGSRHTLE